MLDICVMFGMNWCMNSSVKKKNLFFKVTVTFDQHNLINSRLSPNGHLRPKIRLKYSMDNEQSENTIRAAQLAAAS